MSTGQGHLRAAKSPPLQKTGELRPKKVTPRPILTPFVVTDAPRRGLQSRFTRARKSDNSTIFVITSVVGVAIVGLIIALLATNGDSTSKQTTKRTSPNSNAKSTTQARQTTSAPVNQTSPASLELPNHSLPTSTVPHIQSVVNPKQKTNVKPLASSEIQANARILKPLPVNLKLMRDEKDFAELTGKNKSAVLAKVGPPDDTTNFNRYGFPDTRVDIWYYQNVIKPGWEVLTANGKRIYNPPQKRIMRITFIRDIVFRGTLINDIAQDKAMTARIKR